MAPRSALFGLTALLAGVATAQKPGPTTEVHPKITTQRCNKDGCKEATNYIVLDSLAHPVYQANNTAAGCGGWGEKPPVSVCPTVEACAQNCIMDGVSDYSKYGVTTSGSSLRLQQLLEGRLVSPRVYLLDETKQKYEMLKLTGNEFTFEVDMKKLPCGMNSALYLSEMEAEGGKSALNPGGAYYGTGYCDAQCYVTPFANGLGNIQGKGVCCNEMDIWEANSRSNHIAPHTCNKPGFYLCEGAECTREGVCDKPGCAWNPYRVNVTDQYGTGNGFKVDTLRPFTVVTQFPADANGVLKSINRLYVQDGKVIENHKVDAPGLPKTSEMTDEFCKATGSQHFLRLGGHREMGDAMTRGMVLAMSIWWDEGGAMAWLDGGGNAGPCNATEGFPESIRKIEPSPEVTFTNLRWGDIGTTFKETAPPSKCTGRRRRSN